MSAPSSRSPTRWNGRRRLSRRSSACSCPPRSTPCFGSGLLGGDGGRERGNQAVELARVGIEAADALGELVGRHRVVVVLPAEGFLVERDARNVLALRFCDGELS